VFRHELAGGGGWGDALARDPALVLRDVINGVVTAATARAQYGVVLAGDALDVAATEAERAMLRKARGAWAPAAVNRGALPQAAE